MMVNRSGKASVIMMEAFSIVLGTQQRKLKLDNKANEISKDPKELTKMVLIENRGVLQGF